MSGDVAKPDGWKKKSKGNALGGAKIYTHPEAEDGRAIVVNVYGIHFSGKTYDTLADAKRAALNPRRALDREDRE